ncbi:MAG: cupin domain-containing protein [Solirubrobacterales bacterium]|nr:cupin domain-containing protein [Solirubrobacterales bacterium]
MPTKPYVVNVHELPRESRAGGVMEETAVVMDGALLKFSWGYPGGPSMSGHRPSDGMKPDVHPFDQAILMISGTVEVTLGEDDTYTVGPGHIVYIPANVPHIGRVIGEETAFGVDIFAPVREDYKYMAAHQLSREEDAPQPSPAQEPEPAA